MIAIFGRLSNQGNINDYVYLSQTAIMWQEFLLLDYIKLKEAPKVMWNTNSMASSLDRLYCTRSYVIAKLRDPRPRGAVKRSNTDTKFIV